MARAESTIRVQFDPSDRRLIEKIAKSLDTLTHSAQFSPAAPLKKSRMEWSNEEPGELRVLDDSELIKPLVHNPNTIEKVYNVLELHSVPHELVVDIVNDLQNEGIIFVDRNDVE